MIKNILQTYINKSAYKLNKGNRDKLKILEKDLEDQTALVEKLENRKNSKEVFIYIFI